MRKYIGTLALVSLILFSCKEDSAPKQVEETVEEIAGLVLEKEGITLSTNTLATTFDDARLALIAPAENDASFSDSTMFRFGVDNYDLAINTSDPLSGQCANSGKGQHIHFILNNEPYSAHYNAEFKKQLPAGNNVLLAFLSRSYHMSVKSKDAYVLAEFNAGDNMDEFDQSAPHMFYSRPKGAYVGDNAKKVMLDFYLINTDLKDHGYLVRASINGVSFDLDTWQPFFIEGLQEGENTISLELLDSEGELVPSPYNPVERTISVKYTPESI